MCPRYERHRYVPGREISDISMCTADTRPFSGDDRRLRQALGEFYKDKKYFEYYIDTEGNQARILPVAKRSGGGNSQKKFQLTKLTRILKSWLIQVTHTLFR